MNEMILPRPAGRFGLKLLLAASIVIAPVGGAGAASVVRGPYLQLSSATNITICWRTDVPAESRVVYGVGLGGLNVTNDSGVLRTDHQVTLTELQPDTRYYYAVGTATGLLAGPGEDFFFLTHPVPGTEKPIRVWVIGDAGVSPYGGIFPRHQRAVRDGFVAFNGTNTLHAWLQLGDNAYRNGLDNEFQAAVFNVYPAQLRSAVTWPTLGNHDTASRTEFVDTYPYFDIFHLPTAGEAGGVASGTEHYYSFDLGMVHFVCLDSTTADRSSTGPMANWLRADLAANTNRWTVAYWHHPPYTRGGYDSDAEHELVIMRKNFGPIIEAGGVDLVLSGHSHVYERSALINGHYDVAATFDPDTMRLQSGLGRETNGVGAYVKPDRGGPLSVGNQGTVYVVLGCSGQVVTSGQLNHPVMAQAQRTLGSAVLDFASNRLDVVFLPTNGIPADWFRIIKQGVLPPQILTVTPPGAFVNEGASVSFVVAATGAAPLAYQWQFNETDLAAATNATLTLSNVVFAQAGNYSVQVFSPGGTARSNVVLAVNRSPQAEVLIHPQPLLAANGLNAVAILDGTPSQDPDLDALTHEWFVTGAAAPFATGVVTVATLPVGANPLNLVVTDGRASDRKDFVVDVITVAGALDRLAATVQAQPKHSQPLLASVRAAQAALARDQPAVATHQLEALQHKVTAQVRSADPELAAQLETAVAAILEVISGGVTPDLPLRIMEIRRGNKGSTQLQIQGRAQRPVVVEVSTNLVDWTPVGVARWRGAAAFDFADEQGDTTAVRYYRVRQP